MSDQELDREQEGNYTTQEEDTNMSHDELMEPEDQESIVSEEHEDVNPTTEQVASESVEEPADPYETLARSKGWSPEKGDKTPKDFVEYHFKNKIKSKDSTIDALEQSVSKLTELVLKQNTDELKQNADYYQHIIDNSDSADEVRQATAELRAIDNKKNDLNQYTTQPTQLAQEEVNFLQAHAHDWFPRVNSPNAPLSTKQVDIMQYVQERSTELSIENEYSKAKQMRIIEQEVRDKFESSGSKNVTTKTTISKPKAERPIQGATSAGSTADVNALSDLDRSMYDILMDKVSKADKKTIANAKAMFFRKIKKARG